MASNWKTRLNDDLSDGSVLTQKVAGASIDQQVDGISFDGDFSVSPDLNLTTAHQNNAALFASLSTYLAKTDSLICVEYTRILRYSGTIRPDLFGSFLSNDSYTQVLVGGENMDYPTTSDGFLGELKPVTAWVPSYRFDSPEVFNQGYLDTIKNRLYFNRTDQDVSLSHDDLSLTLSAGKYSCHRKNLTSGSAWTSSSQYTPTFSSFTRFGVTYFTKDALYDGFDKPIRIGNVSLYEYVLDVAQDLSSSSRGKVQFFIRIEGNPEAIFSKEVPSNGLVSGGILGLKKFSEHSLSADLTSMSSSISAVSFELGDVKDSNNLSYFSQLFCQTDFDLLSESSLPHGHHGQTYIDANASTIPCTTLEGFSSSGTIYIGDETITYSGVVDVSGTYTSITGSILVDSSKDFVAAGVTSDMFLMLPGSNNVRNYKIQTVTTTSITVTETINPIPDGPAKTQYSVRAFTGCSRGKYPAIHDASVGRTLALPEGDDDDPMTITQNIDSVLGRTVALYVLTWNDDANDWNNEENAELIYCGRLDGDINWNPDSAGWSVGSMSLTDVIKDKILLPQPETELKGINLGRKDHILIKFYRDNSNGLELVAYKIVTIQEGFYETPERFLSVFINTVNSSAWYLAFTTRTLTSLETNFSAIINEQGKVEIKLTGNATRYQWIVTMDSNRFTPSTFGGNDSRHERALRGISPTFSVLGYEQTNGTSVEIRAETKDSSLTSEPAVSQKTVALAFHLIDNSWNNNKCFVRDVNKLFSPSRYSHCYCYIDTEDAENQSMYEDSKKIFLKYSSIYADNRSEEYVGIETTYNVDISPLKETKGIQRPNYYIAQRWGNKSVKVRNFLSSSPIFGTEPGQFDDVYSALISTGTPSYNTVYDVLPYGCGLGIPSQIVDTNSFIAANKRIPNGELAVRDFYPYCIEPTPFDEVVMGDFQLSAQILTWRRGKLAVVPIRISEIDRSVTTITDSNLLSDLGVNSLSLTKEHIINGTQLKVINPFTEKEDIYTVNDNASQRQYNFKRIQDISHRGIRISDDTEGLSNLIQRNLVNYDFRRPSYLVNCRVDQTIGWKVYVGEIVNFQSALIPDVAGDGTYGTNTYGIVLSVSRDEHLIANLEIILFPNYSRRAQKWAPSALIDKSYSTGGFSGGYDSTAKQLYLVANKFSDSSLNEKDGDAFDETDVCRIIERAPLDPSSAQTWNNIIIDEAFETDGTNILTLNSGTSLTGFDSNKEYIIEFSGYENATTSQRSRGTFQAGSQDELLGSDKAQRW